MALNIKKRYIAITLDNFMKLSAPQKLAEQIKCRAASSMTGNVIMPPKRFGIYLFCSSSSQKVSGDALCIRLCSV